MRSGPSLVLVTGASGFVGGHVVREFLEQGWRVRGSVRNLADPRTDARFFFSSSATDRG